MQQHAGKDLALLMLDIDHFKTINDQFGHDAGDQVLRQLGQMLRQSGRQTDSIARFGGEEFILLLPDTDRQAAICLAERLRRQVQSIRIGGQRLTISLGISTLNAGQAASSLGYLNRPIWPCTKRNMLAGIRWSHSSLDILLTNSLKAGFAATPDAVLRYWQRLSPAAARQKPPGC